GAGAKALNDAQLRPAQGRVTPGRGEHRNRDQPRRPTRESDRAGHADHPESQRVDPRTAPTRNGGYRGQQQQRGGLVTRGRLGEAHLRHLHVGRGMTTTERSHEVKRPTLVRPALRVQAPDGVEWQVEHRISPWRRRIQPIAFVWFMPRRYSEVTPKRPAPRPPSDEDEKTQEIRRPRKNRLEKLPAWLAYITIVLIAVLEMLYGMFVLALMVVDIAARLAVALILSVFLGIEVLAQWIVGSISRLSPKKRGRVDV